MLLMWAAAFFTSPRLTYAQETPAAETMHRAALLNSIDSAGMTPWHLKLSFQLFDAKGTPTEKGTIEEWWADPSMKKIVYTSPSFTSTEMRTKDGFYWTKGAKRAPRLLELVLRQVVHPIPGDSEIANAKSTLREQNFGKTKMDCIMLVPIKIRDVSSEPLGLSPTYCFDHDQDLLRLSYAFISQATLRNRVGSFLGHNVVVDQTTSVASVKVVAAHVDALETMTPIATDFVPSSALEIGPYREGSVVSSGSLLVGPAPIYPEIAKAKHISGHVVLSVIIGRDGRISSAEVISSPDESLSASAITAVKQWTYKPYLLDGKPVEVDTTITMNFNFGPAY